MKTLVIGFLAALTFGSSAQADNSEMVFQELRDGKVSNKQKCVTVSKGFTVKASTRDGRVTVYKTNNDSHGHGIYIGAPESLPYTTNNTTAAPEGIYKLTFEPAIKSISLDLDWLTNYRPPAEALWAFATENGSIQVNFNPVGNTASFDGQKILATSERGKGVLSYSGKPFKTLKFKHKQHPRNIGFTITNIQANTVIGRCR